MAESPIALSLKTAMLHMVTEMSNLRGSLTTDLRSVGHQLMDEVEDLRDDVKALDARVQRVHEKQSASVASQATILSSIVGVLQLAAGGVFETRFRFPEEQEREMQVDEASFSIATGFADGVTERLYGDGESQSRGHAEATEEGTSRPQVSSFNAAASTADGTHNTTLATLIHAAQASATEMSRRHLAELSNSDNPRTTVTQAAGTSSVPEFLLESNHPTVLALWTEWYIGIGDRPSITTMIQKKLPKSEKQRKLFARWKVVIDEVSRLAREQVVPESEVVKKLDEYRGRNKLSITKLQEEIKRKRANKESIV